MAEGNAHVNGSLSDMRDEFNNLQDKKLTKGDTWYLVSREWYNQLSSYLKLDAKCDGDEEVEPPGPINNSELFQETDKVLKPSLEERLNYMLVSSEAWEKLIAWFGKVDNQPPIPRKVIEIGMYPKQAIVEVYLEEIKFYLDQQSSESNSLKKEVSRVTKIGELEKSIKNWLKVHDNVETRLWQKDDGKYELLSRDSCINDVKLATVPMLVLERKKGGTWMRNEKTGQVALENRPGPMSTRNAGYAYDNSLGNSDPGVCGLSNLGNTCFMNSVLQCMSNSAPLVKYFVDDEHARELNYENPLGMSGEIAKAFGELVKDMWSGRHTHCVPRHFKTQVGRFAPQFSGFQQHDSQELLTFLLDGLHEDLNRIKRKPYIEQKDANGRPDQIVARESWQNYKARNNSVIVDLFHGLLKSTVVCPECSKVSVTFDPFCYLSLPMPSKQEVEVVVYPLDLQRKPTRHKILLPKHKVPLRVLRKEVAKEADIDDELRLVVAEVDKYRFEKIYAKDETIDVSYQTNLHVFEVITSNWDSNEQSLIGVYMGKESMDSLLPFLVVVPRKETDLALLYSIILKEMKRYYVFEGLEEFAINGCKEVNGDRVNGDIHMSNDDESELSGEEDSRRSNMDVDSDFKLFTLNFVERTGKKQISRNNGNQKCLDLVGLNYVFINWHQQLERVMYKKELQDLGSLGSSVKRSRTIQLSDCIELFTNKEKLGQDNAWYCPTCKKHQQATKKFDIWELPNMLVIHLKRFSYNRFAREKLDSPVEFPITGLNFEKHVLGPNRSAGVYDLYGVVNHYGGMGGGHYTAYCLNKNDKQWYNFDDSSVSHISDPQSVVTKAAYLLMYQKRQFTYRSMSISEPTSCTDEEDDEQVVVEEDEDAQMDSA